MHAPSLRSTSGRASRLGRALSQLSLTLLAACGGDDDAPLPVPTATSSPANTQAPTGTKTSGPIVIDTPTLAPTATSTSTATAVPSETPTSAPTETATVVGASFIARGSVGQVYVLDAPAADHVELLDGDGALLGAGTTDAQGSFLFREVAPGGGYRVAVGTGDAREVSEPIAVTRADEPAPPSFYAEQRLVAGYQYIETRDGTTLAANVLLPGPINGGPYPTVIEYSGYDPANPTDPEPSTLIANALGYAVVGINIRGSGCSGGAFDFFETLQATDGYDAVEIVAAQSWVKGNKVGMVGISYPGISQLFVAQHQPPHLAAIAPLSVISDIGSGILYPGGILNNGFAVSFASDRQRDAMPGGQPWSQVRIDAGDQVCIDNQKLRAQSANLMDRILANPFYVDSVAGPLSPSTFIDRIDVPVFLAGAWQDEQTGGYFANMLDRFTGTDRVHITLVNGNHIEPLAPAVFSRWLEFLDFYVAERKPQRPGILPLILQVLNDSTFKAPAEDITLEPLRFTEAATYEEALAAYEAEPRVRVLFESGAGASPGSPVPAFEASFDAWPIPSIEPWALYLDGEGKLAADPPAAEGSDAFVYDPSGSQRTNYPGAFEDVWRATVDWDWQLPPAGTSLAYASDPLSTTAVLAGSASADLWLRANAEDVDLQATLSEIHPDGSEVYVQTGWLRASHRKIDPARSTEVRPVQTHLETDAAPLPPGEFVLARIEIYPFAHVFRAGSRVRLTVSAPGGDRAAWKFQALPAVGEISIEVGHSPGTPSRLVLPLVPGLEAPETLPACNSLRGQPCRQPAG